MYRCALEKWESLGNNYSDVATVLKNPPPSFAKETARQRRRRWRSARGGYGEGGRGIDI